MLLIKLCIVNVNIGPVSKYHESNENYLKIIEKVKENLIKQMNLKSRKFEEN